MPILLVGSGNRHKLAEFQALLQDLPLRVRGAEALPSPLRVVESAESFEENARTKALAFARAAAGLWPAVRPRWVVSDDSGLCVDALGGAPGVRSARFAGEGASDSDNNQKLLQELSAVEPLRRGASFVCALACAEVLEGGAEPRLLFEARGECRGRIGEAARGKGGFGYDPLFLVGAGERTYAEMSEEEKNRISHRGRALAQLRDHLRPLLTGTPGALRG